LTAEIILFLSYAFPTNFGTIPTNMNAIVWNLERVNKCGCNDVKFIIILLMRIFTAIVLLWWGEYYYYNWECF